MEGKMPQVFETGIEEVIELPEASNYFKTSKGNDIHLMGYPIGLYIPGGAFIYQMSGNRLTLGFLTGLCYENPLLDLYETFIKFKSHPFVANLIKGGKVVEAGARRSVYRRQRRHSVYAGSERHPCFHEIRHARGRSHNGRY
jgi:electron-transferring-flavoprotein dehydrogenase